MSYRDDHDAALARADAAVHEAKVLRAEHERLSAELADAREWLGGPRKRAVLLVAIVATAGAAFAAGLGIGRTTTEPRVETVRVPVPLPHTFGVILADGPDVGRWAMSVTRCIPNDLGVELTSLGGDDYSIGIIGNDVEIETPTGTFTLEHRHCVRNRTTVVTRTETNPPTFAGLLEIYCDFHGNRVYGRVEFKHCR